MRSIVLIGLGALLLACAPAEPKRVISADQIYLGGPILTMEDAPKAARAIAVADGRISEVIEDLSTVTLDGEVVDLDGKTLMPSFFQAHAHFMFMTIKDSFVNLDPPPHGSVSSIASLQTALKKRAEKTKPGDAIVGMGYDDTLIAEKRHPTRADLDAVSTKHPIVLLHISGHLATMNSAALASAGIDKSTPDPEGGVIQRGEDGRANGVLEESAMVFAQKLIPLPSPQAAFTGFDAGAQKLLALGITTAVDHASDPMIEQGLAAWMAIKKPSIDMLAYRRVSPGNVKSGSISKSYQNGFRVGGYKITIDGSIQGYTGYLSKPYHVQAHGRDADYAGYPVMPKGEFEKLVLAAFETGTPLLVHTNGDAAIDLYIDAVRKGRAFHPSADIRPTFIHAQMMRDDQLDAAKELGMIPSFFGDHVYYWGDRHREVFIGPERATRISPAGSALKKGVTFTLHDDAPVVPPGPLHSVWVATNRLTRSGKTLGADQKIPVYEALKAVTINAAYQHFEDTEKGSLSKGKQADMVILDKNPLDHAAGIRDIKVMQTINDGKIVYSAAPANSAP